MIDYQANVQKKSNRGGSRGVTPSNQAAQLHNQAQNQGVPTGPLLAQKIVQLPKQKQGNTSSGQYQDSDQKMYRGNKIKLDRLQKQDTAVLGNATEQRARDGKVGRIEQYAIVEMDQHSQDSPTQQRNKIKLQQQHIQNNSPERARQGAQMQNPQLQGSQGAQIQKPNGKREIAVISLTTANIEVTDDTDQLRSEQNDGPDDQAQVTSSNKRLSQKQLSNQQRTDSPSSMGRQ